jgi:hypothetical protein
MNFFVSHIYREENCCADGLANVGLIIDSFTIWYESFIMDSFNDNKSGRPNFIFCNG